MGQCAYSIANVGACRQLAEHAAVKGVDLNRSVGGGVGFDELDVRILAGHVVDKIFVVAGLLRRNLEVLIGGHVVEIDGLR